MRQALLLLLLSTVLGIHLQAQPVFSPRNMALGGGGSTYLTSYQTNFYNPANLMIQDRSGDFSMGIGIGGFLLGAVKNYPDPEQQFQNARDYIAAYTEGTTQFGNTNMSDFLDDNFTTNNLLSDNRTRYESTLLGMKWKRETKAFSIAIRTRTASNYEIGKGWYSDEFESINGNAPVLNRTLNQRYQRLHEISFGYAESFQFLTNLTSRLDNFIIGIAPKVVLGGSYLNAEWSNLYEQRNTGVRRTESFSYDASGEFAASSSSFASGMDANTANTTYISNNYFDITGVGAGLDIGITYLITLGSDLSAIRPDQQPTQKSLRLSFAMTDIGFVSYTGSEELSFSSGPDTLSNVNTPNTVADEFFIGAKGQYINFLQKFGETNPFSETTAERGSFSTLLPMALHGGALLEINRVKLMGDVSIGLTNSAFNSPRILSAAGVEIRPLQFLPLRGGIQFKAQRPEFISLGIALETRYWDLSLATQFTTESISSDPILTGISVAALQFHF
ncbi:MAG: DUF5723 family protein [Gracilimonas sp.]|nr:DUF5723 family protein [Gracilimonas sp.]